ncbi:hypothetical protein ATB54_03205 [Xanthomonas translucens]|nr:hypothetical protein ATB54_03205 [Xanthomonas translucens]
MDFPRLAECSGNDFLLRSFDVLCRLVNIADLQPTETVGRMCEIAIDRARRTTTDHYRHVTQLCDSPLAIKPRKAQARQAPAFSGKQLLHQALLVRLEGIELADFRADAGIERNQTAGDFFLFSEYRKRLLNTFDIRMRKMLDCCLCSRIFYFPKVYRQ